MLPDNLRDALQIDEYQSYLGFRSDAPGGNPSDGGNRAIFHGHGAGNQSTVKEQELTEYFRRIGDGLEEFFRDPTPARTPASRSRRAPTGRRWCSPAWTTCSRC